METEVKEALVEVMGSEYKEETYEAMLDAIANMAKLQNIVKAITANMMKGE